jgi:hypothetical protein
MYFDKSCFPKLDLSHETLVLMPSDVQFNFAQNGVMFKLDNESFQVISNRKAVRAKISSYRGLFFWDLLGFFNKSASILK